MIVEIFQIVFIFFLGKVKGARLEISFQGENEKIYSGH